MNYAKAHSVYGADLLGRAFHRFCTIGFTPRWAFWLGMSRVKLHRDRKHLAIKDVQDFRLFDNT